MGSFSIWHWLIVLVVVLLLFGRGKIPELMGDMAKGIKSFKKGMSDEDTADAPKTVDQRLGHDEGHDRDRVGALPLRRSVADLRETTQIDGLRRDRRRRQGERQQVLTPWPVAPRGIEPCLTSAGRRCSSSRS